MQVRPFLMFQGNAGEAIDLYTALVPNSQVIDIVRHPEGSPGAGTVMKAVVSIGGQTVMFSDSPIPHPFGFTPSFSFFIDCESAEQLETLADTLRQGGHVLMPPDNYGFSRRFTWVSDRFGVSWQLNLP